MSGTKRHKCAKIYPQKYGKYENTEQLKKFTPIPFTPTNKQCLIKSASTQLNTSQDETN